MLVSLCTAINLHQLLPLLKLTKKFQVLEINVYSLEKNAKDLTKISPNEQTDSLDYGKS